MKTELTSEQVNTKIQEIKNRQKFHEKENKKRLERSGITEHYQKSKKNDSGTG